MFAPENNLGGFFPLDTTLDGDKAEKHAGGAVDTSFERIKDSGSGDPPGMQRLGDKGGGITVGSRSSKVFSAPFFVRNFGLGLRLELEL